MTKRRVSVMVSTALVAMAVLSSVGVIDAHHAVLRFNLEEMTVTADRIFIGRCLAVEEAEEVIAQGELPVTRYTFEVERAIKGRLPGQITIRQLGHPARRAVNKGGGITMHGRAVNPRTFLHGMSEYRAGDRVVLFLIPNYMGGKVTYPVGLYQGAFFINQLPSGQTLVRNSINNLGLFTAPYNGTRMRESDAKVIFPERGDVQGAQDQSPHSAALAHRRGALPVEDFLGLVEQIVAAHGGERGVIIDTRKGAIRQ
jgi:hypothetical protein